MRGVGDGMLKRSGFHVLKESEVGQGVVCGSEAGSGCYKKVRGVRVCSVWK